VSALLLIVKKQVLGLVRYGGIASSRLPVLHNGRQGNHKGNSTDNEEAQFGLYSQLHPAINGLTSNDFSLMPGSKEVLQPH
jgi:hypothetical protein